MGNKCISLDKNLCCGCGLCKVVCPKGAITMNEDEYGYIIPKIDGEKCIDCGLCKKKCAFIQSELYCKDRPIEVYAAALRDQKLIQQSASGGMFAGFAQSVINDGGVVYGAAWNEDFSVSHIGIKSEYDLHKLQSSKYTQSSIDDCYIEVERLLNSDVQVLFSGTPCQVASLKSYLGKDYSNLLTIDLICHGVGSNRMLQDDIRYFQEKYKNEVERISFRTKRNGWGTSGEIILKDGSIKNYSTIVSPYYYYYLDNSIFRDSCYNCPYATGERVGDFTIGDYWRIESAHPDIQIDIEKGVSCLLVNSQKGKMMLEKMRDKFLLFESDFDAIYERNAQLASSCEKPYIRDVILEKYKTMGYCGVSEYWKKTTIMQRGKLRIYRLFPNKIKIAVKRILKR